MNSLLFVIVIFFTPATHSFKAKKIEGIEGRVKIIEFDSDFNTHVVATQNGSSYFHTIDAEQKIIFTQKFNDVHKVLVNKKGDVYVVDRRLIVDNNKREAQNLLWIMKRDSQKFSKLFYWEGFNELKAVIDSDNNLFFSVWDKILFHKNDQNLVIYVSGLAGEITAFESDSKGDAYFMSKKNERTPIFVLRRESKNQQRPRVEKLSGGYVADVQFVSFGKDFDGYMYFSTRRMNQLPESMPESYISKADGELILLDDLARWVAFLCPTKDRLYFTRDMHPPYFSISYISKDGRVAGVDDLFIFSSYVKGKSLCVSDGLGNAFLVHGKSVLSIRFDGTEVRNITTPSGAEISAIAADQKGDFWILAGNLYFYKNGMGDAVMVANLSGDEASPMKENKKTGEIYVGSGSGLSVFVNDNM